MRFAYIDSQGNEVTIPSVEALGLRIELGAIGPDTELYDGQADRWGPASSHEIFHTLSRAMGTESHTVSPHVAPTFGAPEGDLASEEHGAPGEVTKPPPEAEPVSDLADELEAPSGEVPPVGEPSAPEETTPEEDVAPTEAEFVFDLTDEFQAPSGEEPPVGETSSPDDDRSAETEPRVTADDDLSLDLTLVDMGIPAGGDEGDAPPEASTQSSAEPPAASEDIVDFSASLDLSGGLDLEPPLSELTPEATPFWAGEDQEPPHGDAMVFGSGAPKPPEGGDRDAGAPSSTTPPRRYRERPTPRNRPSPPRPVKRRSSPGLIVGIVVVAIVGGGGWLGWRWYQGRGTSGPEGAATAASRGVSIPEIPAALLPRMRDLGDAALAATVGRMHAMADTLHLSAAPDSDWLAGVYMANASRYGDVHDYWMGLKGLVDSLRAEDAHLFHDEYRKQLEAASLAGDTARILLERADSGFLATRGDREEAYSLMDNLVTAALDLHQFLTENESEIEYDPAAGGMSRDPVLEAVPKTKELGKEMWSRVDRITAALDALGTLDKVTTGRLTAVLFDRIRRAGFE
jgi:hypothetical protein